MSEDFDELTQRIARQRYKVSDAAAERHRQQLEHLTRAVPDLPRRGGSVGPRRRFRKTTTVVAGIVAALAIGVGTAAAFGVFSTPPTLRDIAHCYTTVDLDDPTNHNDFAVALDFDQPDLTADAAAMALDICAGGWAQGRFSDTDPKITDPQGTRTDYPVPPLTACVLDDGSVAVFPGTEEVCNDLGIANALL